MHLPSHVKCKKPKKADTYMSPMKGVLWSPQPILVTEIWRVIVR